MSPWGMSGIRLPRDFEIIGGGFYYPWGIGVCYQPRDDYTYFNMTSSLKSGPSTQKFKESLLSAFTQLQTMNIQTMKGLQMMEPYGLPNINSN